MIDKKRIEAAIFEILKAVGREDLEDTPRRVAEMYEELLSGYLRDYTDKLFYESSDMVIMKGIKFFSLCEHHILPFFGEVDIAYIPNKNVVGASKLSRLVQKHSRRLQIQERMTKDIADELMKKAKPKGVMVVTRGQHLCMMMRGAKSEGYFITSAIRGAFEEPIVREEALLLMNRR